MNDFDNFYTWATKEQRGAVALKDIDPSNDDQRKAAFARMAEDGSGGGGDGGSSALSGKSPTGADLLKHVGGGDGWKDVSKFGLSATIGSATLGSKQKVKIIKARRAYRKDEVEIMSDSKNKLGQNLMGTVHVSTRLNKK